MGAWSHEPFGNDTANDWAYGLEETTDTALIEEALDKVLAAKSEYLEAPDAEEAIAAVEVVAKMLGRGTQTDAYTEKVDKWILDLSIKPSESLKAKSALALKRILSADSELNELWSESEDASEWQASVHRLLAAVEA